MYGIPFFVSLLAFCGIDSALTSIGLEGVYYAVHTIHNAGIVYLTAPEVYQTLTDFNSVAGAPTNYFAAELVFALHLYHFLYYWRKFRFDDWLHHILMIGIALPIGITVPSGTLLGFSLFFTTGLPGGVGYAALWLERNGCLSRLREKQVSQVMNV
jgi:hypothetical protein